VEILFGLLASGLVYVAGRWMLPSRKVAPPPRTSADAPLLVNLPSDIRVTLRRPREGQRFRTRAEFEQALGVHGLRQDRVIRALHHPEVETALAACTAAGATVNIAHRKVVLTVTHLSATDAKDEQPDPVLDALAKDLAAAFDCGWRTPWEAITTEFGLIWDGATVSGVIDGIAIAAEEIPTQAGWHIRIRAQLPLHMADGFRVRRGSGGLKTGDLMLDTALRIETTDPAQARQCLTRPGLREPLLELIHGHPASEVSETEIVVHVTHWLNASELKRHLKMIVDLAQKLQP